MQFANFVGKDALSGNALNQNNNDYNKLIGIFGKNISPKKIEQVYIQTGNNFEAALEKLLDISSKLALLKTQIDDDNVKKKDVKDANNKALGSCENNNNTLVSKKKRKKKKKKKNRKESDNVPRYMRINSPKRVEKRAPYVALSPAQLKEKKKQEHLAKVQAERLRKEEVKKKLEEEKIANTLMEVTKNEGNLIVLSEVFPDIPIRVLKSLLKHCYGNVDKTMERIITMYEDGIFNNNANLVVNEIVDTHTNALDLFAPEEHGGGNNALESPVRQCVRKKVSPKLKRLCESFPDAHPFFVHSLLKNFNNNITDVEDGLKAFDFKKGTSKNARLIIRINTY